MRKAYKSIWKIFLVVFLFVLVTSNYVSASEQVNISQAETEDGQINIYINGVQDKIKKVNCLIASTPVSNITYTKINQYIGSVDTLLLIDDSESITKEERQRLSALILDYIDHKNSNESISIATYGTKLRYLCNYEKDRYEILKAFGKIQFKNQSSYLTDVIAKVTSDLQKRKETSLKRIIVFSDGFDNNENGITKEELYNKLENTSYPIYTIGCVHLDNKKELKELFALARLTQGKSYRFDKKTKVSEVRKSIENVKDYIRISINPENELQDGSIKTVELKVETLKNTYELHKDIRMNMAEKDTSLDIDKKVKATDKKPSHEEGIYLSKTMIIIIISVVVGLLILIIIGIIWWKHKKKEKKILSDINNKVKKPDIIISGGKNVSNQEYSSNIGRSFMSAGDELDKTVVLHQEDIFDKTIMLSPDQCLWSVKLKDIRNNRIFVKELRNELVIGRVGNSSDQAKIIIDYESSVSKRHCRIYLKESNVYIVDMGSSNHTFLNGVMLNDEQLLKDGDVIGVGNLSLEVALEKMEMEA
ncbi:hypothetical protein bsdtb5_12740 [Anaeromicropila herbilytica]|uniref:FHA domain-containing protein n=2 Tax=Anaeromicropila herbilytica TaxID=2785025 RepID=A0A7R7EJN4_9FIRM|nr:hypothetical protein bsdtb5_12740 [Anaeromicropila herbilytica]